MVALPSDELVMVAWLRTLSSVPAGGVSTSLPRDTATWAASGFVQVVAAGGGVDAYVPMNSPVLTVHTWAGDPNSDRPPWPKASQLIEAIVWHTYELRAPVTVDLPAAYYDAYVHSVYPVGRPRRVPGDPGGYAHLVVDLAMAWNPARNVA